MSHRFGGRTRKIIKVIVNKLVKFSGILLVISLLALPLVGCAKIPLTPLTLTVEHCITDATVKVSGQVSDPKATVWVNDTKAMVSKAAGDYWAYVELAEGENTIKVVATRGDEVVTKTITVTYTPSE